MLTNKFLYIKEKDKIYKINQDEIVYVVVEEKHCSIYMLSGNSYTTRKTLKEIAKFLNPLFFIQIHRAHIVNIVHVTEIKPNEISIKANNINLPFGRHYKESFLKKINPL